MHNKLMEGPKSADYLDAKVAHSTKNRSDLKDNASYVSRAKGNNFVPVVLGPLSLGTSVPIASTFISHLCAFILVLQLCL